MDVKSEQQNSNVLMKSFDVFPWNEYFNTGIDKIDEQHKRLFELLNRLCSHIAFHSDVETLDIVFDGLTDYAVYHFQTEEAIWHEYLQQDELEVRHKDGHKNFIEAVLNLKSEKNTDSTGIVISRVSSFIMSWLVSHILEDDKYMALVVLAIQSGLSQEQAEKQAKSQLQRGMKGLVNIILSTYSNLSTNTIKLMYEAAEHKNAKQELIISALQLNKSIQQLNQTNECLAQTNESLTKQYKDTIHAFSRIIEKHTGIKGAHSKYIIEKAMQVSVELKVDIEQKRDILYAGLLMQIGKISLPDALLTVPYITIPLAEKRRYLNHAVEGGVLLNGLTQLKAASVLIRHQYERYDGTGFPDRLAKQKIPFGSRILSVIRDYIEYLDGSQTGETMSTSVVISKLEDRIGSYYDPDILSVFIKLLKEDQNVKIDEESTLILKKRTWKSGLLINREKIRKEKEKKLGVEISWPQLKIGMKIVSVHFNDNPYILNCIADKKIISDILSMSERISHDPVIKVIMV